MNHYTYRIINTVNNNEYIGARSCKCDPIDDLGKKYFSSSSHAKFMLEQKEHSWRFKYQIISIHSSKKSALYEEILLHNFFDVGVNKKYYNKVKQSSSSFDSTGLIPVKDKDGNTSSVSKDDPKYLSGEYFHVSTGLVVVKDKNGNTSSVNKDDPRYLSGELVGSQFGFISVKDKDGNTSSVSKDDPRYLSGELVGIRKGYSCEKAKQRNELNKKAIEKRKYNKDDTLIEIFNHRNESLVIIEKYKLKKYLSNSKMPSGLTSTAYSNKKLYQTNAAKGVANKNGYIMYIGWYARFFEVK